MGVGNHKHPGGRLLVDGHNIPAEAALRRKEKVGEREDGQNGERKGKEVTDTKRGKKQTSHTIKNPELSF